MTLPDKFRTGPKSEHLSRYIAKRYGACGYPKNQAQIAYNPESKDNRYRWVENPKDGLRFTGTAHDVAREAGYRGMETGWYIDPHQDQEVHGEVYQLPARHGVPQYVPGVSDPDNEASLIDFRSTYDTAMDAAMDANGMAERYADDAREGYARDQAEQRIEEITAEIRTHYADFRALATEIRANQAQLTGLAEVRKLIRCSYRRMRTQIRKLRKQRATIQDNYWTAVEC